MIQATEKFGRYNILLIITIVGEIVLNNKTLVSSEAAENGRFTLYPTKNMYNFILLDQKDGKIWQVQWSVEEENRVVIPM